MKVTDSEDWAALTRAIGRGEVFRINDKGDRERRRWAGRIAAKAVEQRLPVTIEELATFDGSTARTRPQGPLVGGTETVFTPVGVWPNVP